MCFPGTVVASGGRSSPIPAALPVQLAFVEDVILGQFSMKAEERTQDVSEWLSDKVRRGRGRGRSA